MKRIPREQYEVAYQVGMRRHLEGFGLAEAVSLLQGEGMEDATASILAGNVSYLLKGEVYKRAMSIEATDDYLTWIRRDRGDDALRNALRALAAHIEYWESTHPGRRRGLREILATHELLLSDPLESSILLEYTEVFARGYVDILPLNLFAEEGIKHGVVHVVRSKASVNHEAKCDVRVSQLLADLDYEPYEGFNSRDGMIPGVARLHFADEDRTSIRAIEWKSPESTTFHSCSFRVREFFVPPSPPYVPPTEKGRTVNRQVHERLGQTVFRRNLKLVYGNRCCISGCAVPEVLEGAHIDPHQTEASDNMRNGLLLRSDLHALFDRFLISIDPTNLVVVISDQVRADDSYTSLAGNKMRLPRHVSHHPDPGALERHWNQFKTRHGL